MTVLRIVANIAAPEPAVLADFYRRLLGLDVVMDHGWIVTLAGRDAARVQFSIASAGGSGTPVPALSIEVDDVDAVHAAACETGTEIVHPLTDEPWGVRRFFLRDPAGTIVNILAHRHDGQPNLPLAGEDR